MLLEMNGISKRFGPVPALSDVSFTVSKGTVHALVGENGAGKSTLMKILAGVHLPDSGTITIDGKSQSFVKPSDALKAGISMIYQELDLAEDLSVAENFLLGEEPRGKWPFTISYREMVRITETFAASYGFEIEPNAIVCDLSTGDCQIIEILKALHRKSRIIVMDEPTSSLCEDESVKLMEIIRRLRDQGISIVYISHRLEEILNIADNVTVLRDGRVIHSEAMQNLDIPRIVHYMVGRELNDFYPRRNVETGKEFIRVENLCGDGFEEVSFDIKCGEVVGMAGLIGAGRTQIGQCLFGVRAKKDGKIIIDDNEVEIKSPHDAIKYGMAFLTEDRKRTGLCLNLPCIWNVTLPSLKQLGMEFVLNRNKELEAADVFAKRLNISWLDPQALANSLSGGNQQKLLIARWLVAESRFLIFDEPTRGID